MFTERSPVPLGKHGPMIGERVNTLVVYVYMSEVGISYTYQIRHIPTGFHKGMTHLTSRWDISNLAPKGHLSDNSVNPLVLIIKVIGGSQPWDALQDLNTYTLSGGSPTPQSSLAQ